MSFWSDDEQVEWMDAAQKVGSLFAVQQAGPAYQGGFGHGGGATPEEATFSAHVLHVHGDQLYDVEVDSDASWPPEMDTWRLLTDWLHGAMQTPTPEDIEFPFELTIRADRWTSEFVVDGVAQEFLIVGEPQRWSASARLGGRSVRVRGTGPDSLPVALVGIAPEAVSDELPDDPVNS